MTATHYPGHLRGVFDEAICAWLNWRPGEPEPKVEYDGEVISLSDACCLVWSCGDTLPGLLSDRLIEQGLPIKRRTYAAAARAMLRHI
jgi:hypothetical protein